MSPASSLGTCTVIKSSGERADPSRAPGHRFQSCLPEFHGRIAKPFPARRAEENAVKILTAENIAFYFG
jgi:hypothetical protein